MKKLHVISFLCSIAFLSFVVRSPYGIDAPTPIEPFLNHVFPKESPSYGNWKAVNAFPNLTFPDPIAMEEIPNAGYYYIAGKEGYIWLVEDDENTTEKTVALDVTENVITSGDAGLINFILHPEFAIDGADNEGVLLAFYAFHPSIEHGEDARMNRLSKFRTFENSLEIDPDSEEILIQDYDPQGWHMGGGMFFDNEGFFYLTFGDGGMYNDFYNASQKIDERFWGGIIRIDIDNNPTRSHPIKKQPVDYWNKPPHLPASFTQGYMIPNDNPWVSDNGDVMEEFFGLGLRSPHRAAYDTVEEKIWIADVGQQRREEITIMPKGGNAQWPYREGSIAGPKPKPNVWFGEEVEPIFDYGRTEGVSIIGGFVYRGEKWKSSLEGLYLFGEFGTREIWSLNQNTGEVVRMTSLPEFGVGGKNSISSFGTNAAGDVFILKLYGENTDGGIIYRLEKNNTLTSTIPSLLSETGAFTDLENMIPADGIIPYRVNNPLWSDGASKKRWIAVPNDGVHDSIAEQIKFFEDAEWQFPNGTVFIKHFELPKDVSNPSVTQKVETRFFVLDEKGRGYGLSYKWNEAGTDAVLLETSDVQSFEIIDEMGQSQTQVWEYPSRTECLTCHNANSDFVLGVNTWQLNGDLKYPSGVTSNQLATWNHLGMFADTIEEQNISNLPQAVPLSDEHSLQDQVSSYLASNCAHCHRPNGVDGVFDARLTTPMAYKKIINNFGVSRNTPEGELIVSAGHPELSHLWLRDNSLEEDKMPPVAKTIVDEKYMSVLTEWIEGLKKDCSGSYLSDFEFATTPENGVLTPILKDNKEKGIYINGKSFERGLRVNAFSKLEYHLNKKFVQLNTFIGLNVDACEKAELVFEVYGDDKIIYRSPVMKKYQDPRFISVDVKDVNKVTLVVHSPQGDSDCNIAHWADAKLLRFPDSDGDGVCDDYDLCEGADDRIDENNDGIPDDCERVDEFRLLETLVFPNPFTEYVEVLLGKPDPLIQKAKLTVYDLNGRMIYQNFNVPYGYKYRIESDWSPGVYVIHVKAGNFENRVKVIKSHY